MKTINQNVRMAALAASVASLAVSGLGPRESLAQGGSSEPTAQEIQERIRYSYALRDVELVGRLDGDGDRDPVPFRLIIEDGNVGFHFFEPRESLILAREGDDMTLIEQGGGRSQPVPDGKFSEPVRGTDVLHEDLAMRFLYWPWVNKVGQETIKNRTAWKLHIQNTGRIGPYSQVFLWADAKTAALMKLEAFDWKGHLVKRFEVVSGQKVDDVWVPKKMSIVSYDPDSPDPRRPRESGKTSMEFREPRD